MLKRDVYRIFKVLVGIERGTHWLNYYVLKNLRYYIYLQKYHKLILDLQNNSNTFLQIFIFVTMLFLGIIELFRAFYPLFSSQHIVGIITAYLVLILILILYYRYKNHEITSEIESVENDFLAKISKGESELEESRIKDEIIITTIERKFLNELADEYLKAAKRGEISVEEAETELKNIVTASEELKNKIENYLKELDIYKRDNND